MAPNCRFQRKTILFSAHLQLPLGKLHTLYDSWLRQNIQLL